MVLLWVYYSSLILFFGAATTRAAIRVRGDRIVPKPTAVRVRVTILEEQDSGALTPVETVDPGAASSGPDSRPSPGARR
jgi:membrane protein